MQILGSCPKYSLPRPAPSVLASLGVGEAGRLWLGRFSRSARFLRLSGRTCCSTVVPSYGHWVSPHSKNKNTGHRVAGRWRAAQNRGALASGIPAQVFCRVQPKPCSEAQELPSQRYGTISNLSAPCKKGKPGHSLPEAFYRSGAPSHTVPQPYGTSHHSSQRPGLPTFAFVGPSTRSVHSHLHAGAGLLLARRCA